MQQKHQNPRIQRVLNNIASKTSQLEKEFCHPLVLVRVGAVLVPIYPVLSARITILEEHQTLDEAKMNMRGPL